MRYLGTYQENQDFISKEDAESQEENVYSQKCSKTKASF
jgi:hypothetical protein